MSVSSYGEPVRYLWNVAPGTPPTSFGSSAPSSCFLKDWEATQTTTSFFAANHNKCLANPSSFPLSPTALEGLRRLSAVRPTPTCGRPAQLMIANSSPSTASFYLLLILHYWPLTARKPPAICNDTLKDLPHQLLRLSALLILSEPHGSPTSNISSSSRTVKWSPPVPE
jgi:hypothetical protein